MLQTFSAYNTYSDTMLYLPCPNCSKMHEINLPAFVVAINHGSQLMCVDCKCNFLVKLTCLRRVAEQRDAPVRAEQKCPSCENGIVYDAEFDKWFNCSACNGTGISNRSAGG